MPTKITLSPPLTTVVLRGGQSVLAANPDMGLAGGMIFNPTSAIDQGLTAPESLFVNLFTDAALAEGVNSTVELVPGQAFVVPPRSNVWVNATSSGHRFAGIFTSSYVPQTPPQHVPGMPDTPGVPDSGGPGAFPPSGPTGLLLDIPMYLYQRYSDDEDLQGYVGAVNSQQQNFVDTFNALNLPIYTGPVVSGKLLDWVAMGLYGMARPALASGKLNLVGPLNTWGCGITEMETSPNELQLPAIDMLTMVGALEEAITDDDTFRRILTWHFYKGDGKYFNNRWLERRVWRFCYGVNGTAPDAVPEGAAYPSIADTSRISISHGPNRNVTIRFVLGQRTVHGGAMLNKFGCNGFGPLSRGGGDAGSNYFVPIPLNDLETTYVPYGPLPFMRIFQEGIASGVLETPAMFDFTVVIG